MINYRLDSNTVQNNNVLATASLDFITSVTHNAIGASNITTKNIKTPFIFSNCWGLVPGECLLFRLFTDNSRIVSVYQNGKWFGEYTIK